jgi:hypothetical protein
MGLIFAVAQAKVTHILRPGKASEKTPKRDIPPSLCEISQNASRKKNCIIFPFASSPSLVSCPTCFSCLVCLVMSYVYSHTYSHIYSRALAAFQPLQKRPGKKVERTGSTSILFLSLAGRQQLVHYKTDLGRKVNVATYKSK